MTIVELGTAERPLRAAVIGSGPSGFYAAESLLHSEVTVQVDMFDKLPVPFGLVRFGVAPDHYKIKSVVRVYDKIAQDERFAFWGNVHVGQDLTVDELRSFYDVLIFATGAQTDKSLPIKGIDLPGSWASTEFVGWYNGHPDYQDCAFDLNASSAVIIGHGNVALDVARILAKTSEELAHTDITQSALKALEQSQVKEIHLVGRRGPIQATFTDKELRELLDLADCNVVIREDDLKLAAEDQEEHDTCEHGFARKNYTVLCDLARLPHDSGKSKTLYIHFYLNPACVQGERSLTGVLMDKTRLEGPAHHRSAIATGEQEQIDCGLLFRSIGYYGVPIEGLPFDTRKGVIPNSDGRVNLMDGVYVVGWIKRGPTGVIGTNKPDSVATVKSLLADLPRLKPCLTPSSVRLKELLVQRGVQVVSFADWKLIDAAEIAAGEQIGKPREKFTSVSDMLAALERKTS